MRWNSASSLAASSSPESLDDKLAAPPDELTDRHPGPALRIEQPGRSAGLRIVAATQTRVPGPEGMSDPAQRPRLLHALANHELQAAELFAWALLAFPDAPQDYRQGLVSILRDEQRHTKMYAARVRANGAEMGDFPVSGYFWNKTPHLTTPLRFVCAMSLTFENANLDHTVDLAELARRGGDEKTAAVIDRVHQDEIEHVRFGWRWLRRLKDEDQTEWEAVRGQSDLASATGQGEGTPLLPPGAVKRPGWIRISSGALKNVA